MIVGESGVREFLNATGASVGMDSITRYRSAITRIEPGEVLFGYTDGTTEAMSPDEILYSKERFFALLARPASAASVLIERVKVDLFNHTQHAPQSDDITMIAVHRKARLGR